MDYITEIYEDLEQLNRRTLKNDYLLADTVKKHINKHPIVMNNKFNLNISN